MSTVYLFILCLKDCSLLIYLFIFIHFCCLPARCSNKCCSGDGRNGGVLLVVVLDAFEPLQVHDAKHGQRQADPKEYQTHIEPPTGKTGVEMRKMYLTPKFSHTSLTFYLLYRTQPNLLPAALYLLLRGYNVGNWRLANKTCRELFVSSS